MSGPRPPAGWLLTPLLAFTTTLAGVVVLFHGQSALVPALAGGIEQLCADPDCALGIGLLLIAGGFGTLCAAVAAGIVVGVRHRRQPAPRPAVRRGLLVSLWCLLAYLLASSALWLVVSTGHA